MRKFSFLLVILVPLFIGGCQGYEKLLKSNDYNLKYKKAFEYYNKGDYSRALTLFDQITTYFRGTTRADSVYYYQAMVNFKLSDYIIAGHYFKTFAEIFGNSQFVEDANFYVGYCYYLTSPRPELDQTDTYNALQSFRLFLIKFPDTERKEEVEKMIIELREKLVEKSFISARLYFDLGDYKASIVALNNSLNEYPESKYREDIMFLILKSNYLLAFNSVYSKQKERYQAALDEYYSFVTEFPESKYIKEAERFHENTLKFLKDSGETTISENNTN